MKIFMITRGSQGDVLPYLATASELTRRGHEVAINLPTEFESRVKETGWKYYLQKEDDISNLLEEQIKDTDAIKWIGRVMDHQCTWLPDVVKGYDVLVATNTEMAAPTIAEHLGIPFIRTTYAPILPSKIIPPPLFPWPKPSRIITPNMLWYFSRTLGYWGLKKIINKNRALFGLKPLTKIYDFQHYTSIYGNNALTYSSTLADADPAWDAFSWKSVGYCFNDEEYYDASLYDELMQYVKADSRPLIFFTIGSCDYAKAGEFHQMLVEATRKLKYRLIVGAGWSKQVNLYHNDEDVFVLKGYLPHSMILPHCDAIIHHGGCGTTHSAARFALPQLHLPLIIDQHYWAYQCFKRGVSPDWLRSQKVDVDLLTEKVRLLIENPKYKTNARRIANEMSNENGIETFCNYIETIGNSK